MNVESLPLPPEVIAADEPAADLAQLLLEGDERTLAMVSRWISEFLVSPRFWRLRPEWRDIHQETLMGVLRSLRTERFDPRRDFRAYVRGVARHTALHALRRNASRRAVAAELSRLPTAWDPRDKMTMVLLIRRLLDLATPQCRAMIRAHFLEQRNYEELARLEGVPEGTIKSRLSRCLERAHRFLQGELA